MSKKNILNDAADAPRGSQAPGPLPVSSGSSGVDGAVLDGGEGAGGGATHGRLRMKPDFETDRLCALFPLTDMGNAERWRAREGRDFRFCAEIGWFAWDGKRWELLSEEKDTVPQRVTASIARTIRAIRNEADLVAASGCIPPMAFASKAERVNFDIGQLEVERAAQERYYRNDDGALEALVTGCEPMDRPVDINKNKYFSTTIMAWAKSSESGAMPGRMLKWIKGFPDIVVRPDAFDADAMVVNVLNGTLRFKRQPVKRSTEEVQAGKSEWKVQGWKVVRTAHDRADLITKLAPVKYLPASACPEYDAFMLRVQPDEAMRRFIHQWGGYSLTGDTSEQKLAFFYGSGRNGKGTWVETIAHLAGDYAGSIPIESFLDNSGKRRGDQATPDLARLPGVRFLRVSEPERGAQLNEGLVKQVTGQDPLDARHLNKGFFTFMPDFKMTISGNHKPKIKDNSDGIWRRMQLVPWAVQIPADQVDRKLGDKLRSEASGILNRLLQGLTDWLEHGLIEPDQVRNATRAYRDSSDQLGRFLHDCCEVGDDELKVRVRASDLKAVFDAWVEATGGAEWKAKGFKDAMEERGFVQKHSNGAWWVKVQTRPGISAEAIKAGEWSAPAGDSQ